MAADPTRPDGPDPDDRTAVEDADLHATTALSAGHAGSPTERADPDRLAPQPTAVTDLAPPTIDGYAPPARPPETAFGLRPMPHEGDTAELSGDDREADPRTPGTRYADEATPHDGPPSRAPRSGDFWDTVDASGQFQPGQVVFHRYVIQKKLGAGGMGDVWLVKHKELNADRALKVIISRISFEGQARARFRREAQIMASFHHPNAVTVHDARLTEQDVAYIDMEYVEGRSLSEELRKGEPMPVEWVARVLDQLCDVLQVAHDKGIVHRDLKPANLMLLAGRAAGREHLKVLDFGIAKILKDAEITEAGPHTQTGAFLGTPYYASPEQVEGESDTRSDLYSVGVILYEFLTGFRPFTGPAARVFVDVVTTPPPPFARANPAVSYPPEVEALVMRCLAKKPEGRPQTAREVAELFRAAVPSLGPSQVVKVEVAPPFPWLKAVAALLMVAIAGMGIGWAMRRTPKVPPVGPVASPKSNSSLLPAGFAAAPKAEVDAQGRPTVLTAKGEAEPLGLRMIVLPGGTFKMGEPKVAHDEAVGDFAIGDAEVTNGQMHAYLKARNIDPPPKEFEDAIAELKKFVTAEEAEDHPAVNVPREMAVDFARWAGGSLPTEAQWEYAARSCGKADRYYVWPDAIPPKYPLKSNSGKTNLSTLADRDTTTAPVRTFGEDRTDQGVFDLMGNVREWCRDAGPRDGVFVARGGSYYSQPDQYSNFAKDLVRGTELSPHLGFRIVVEMPPTGPAKR